MDHSLEGIIYLDNWWDDENAVVKHDSLLSILKFTIIDALFSFGILENKDLDNNNITPYIKLTTESIPRNQIIYNSINGRKIFIQFSDIVIREDSIELNFREPFSQFNMILVHKKFIGKYKSQIMQIIANIFHDLYRNYNQTKYNKSISNHIHNHVTDLSTNTNINGDQFNVNESDFTNIYSHTSYIKNKNHDENTELIGKLISDVCVLRKQLDSERIENKSGEVSINSTNNLCVICFSNERNCCFVPCGHICTCYDCAKSITENKCPICRSFIKDKIKTFIS